MARTQAQLNLPELIDTAGIARELNVSRRAAEAIMRQLPTVTFKDLRKLYAKRADLQKLIDDGTWPPAGAATGHLFSRPHR